MVDGRRTRWVAHDVYFLDAGLGAAMYDKFGGVGIALWHGFIAACKKNHIEGQTAFANEAEALAIFGLPGMPLVDSQGKTFTLDRWLRLLSAHKVIRRTTRARQTQVVCTKWTRWQQAAHRSNKAAKEAARRAEADKQNPSSEAGNTATESPRSTADISTDLDTDTDRDRDTDLKPPSSPPTPPPRAATKHQRPAGFTAKASHITYATQHGLDLDDELARFANNADAKGHAFADWDKALQLWLQQAVGFGRGRKPAANGTTPQPTPADYRAMAAQVRSQR